MKRGISLIAVLMFMLAATTASIVVFRMLGSEGFSSGARLKASEAYQASESGIDAVRSWLANRGTEAGDLVTQYMAPDEKKPIEIKFSGIDTSKVKAYVVGVDVSGGNSKPVRMKILVEGKGRDNSIVTQTAILSVSGLYKITQLKGNDDCIGGADLCNSSSSEPSSSSSADPGAPPPTTNPAIQPCTADPPPSSTGCIRQLPDLWGNMATAGFIDSRTMIITQTPSGCNAGGQALNTIKIGTLKEPGYLILDGNYYTNNGISIYGDLYATGKFDFCASGNDFITGNIYVEKAFHPRVSTGTLSIGGTAYFADSVNPNVEPQKVCNPSGTGFVSDYELGCRGQLGGKVKIGKNTTIIGPYLAYRGDDGGGSLEFDIGGSLVMGPNSYIDLGASNQSSKKLQEQQLEVQQNVWLRKSSNPFGSNLSYDKTKPVWPIFGKNSDSKVCLQPSVSSDGTDAGYNVWKGGSTFYLKTKGGTPNNCTGNDSWNASQMEDLKAEISGGSSSSTSMQSCNRPPVAFDTAALYRQSIIGTANWVHKNGKPGSCPSTSNNLNISAAWSDLPGDLKKCWNGKSNSELYNNEWFVIYIKNQNHYNQASGDLGNGKYIIIFDFDKNYSSPNNYNYLYLPPTGPNAYVMLYLPNGFPGTIELGGTETGKVAQLSKYNYFIFSNGDIGQFNTTKDRKLHGNVFMNNCGIMNKLASSQNPYFYSEGNDAFVQLLMASGILKNTEWACKAGSGTNAAPTYELACTAPPATGTEGKAITPPTVTCKGSNGTSKANCGFAWTNAPIWAYPVAGTYNVKVTGNLGDCNGKAATCGTLTVSLPPPSSSSAAPSSSSAVPSSSSGFSSGSNYDYDLEKEPWIPISSRLSVKVESKEISKEKAPANPSKLEKSILVMPRIVRVAKGTDISGNNLRKYYSYMPLNGAKPNDITSSSPECCNKYTGECSNQPKSEVDAMYTCFFPENIKPRHSSFYLMVGNYSSNELNPKPVAKCKLVKSNGTYKSDGFYTQGENIKLDITCGDGKPATDLDKADFKVYGEFSLPTGYANWKSGSYTHFQKFDRDSTSGMITVSEICDGSDEVVCEPYLTIIKPTCYISRGPYLSTCATPPPTGSKVWSGCVNSPLVESPTHDCGSAAKYSSGTLPPYFNYETYASENNDQVKISATAPTWNTNPSEGHSFGSDGLNRTIRMYEVSCDGNRLMYGTKTGNEGIVCGKIDVIRIGDYGTSFGNSICEDLNLCGGNVKLADIKDNTTVKPLDKQCVFVSDYSALTTTGSGGTILINGTPCTGSSKNCMDIPKPDKIDGGYYIYIHSGISGSAAYTVIAGKKPDCSGITYTLSCANVPATGTVGAAITPPKVTCGSTEVSTGSLDWGNSAPSWYNPALGTYSGISVSANAGNCIGKSAQCSGTLVVSSYPTITCNLAKGDVTQGENIGQPTITCSTGAKDASQAYFSGFTPANGDWRTGSAYYGASQTDNGAIQVSNVKCGDITVSGNTDCKYNGSNIIVRKPNCDGVSGNATIGQTITPNVSCRNAAKSGTPTFNGGDGWNDNGSGGGSYNSTGSKTVSLSSVTCDGHLISGIQDVSCGNVNVASASTSVCTSGQTLTESGCNTGAATNGQTFNYYCNGSFQMYYYGQSGATKNIKVSGSGCNVETTLSTTSKSNPSPEDYVPVCNSSGVLTLTAQNNSWTSMFVRCAPASPGGGSSSSGGGCVAGSTEYACQSSMQNLGTGAVCIKKSGNINGWNANSADGRTCTPSGGSAISPTSGTITGSAVNATSDGNAYINCTAGTHSYFGMGCW